jgi:hypothetical protein
MGCAFGQGQLNQSEGESEWGVHSDRGQSIQAQEVIGTGSGRLSRAESEWGGDSDRSKQEKGEQSPNGVVIRTEDS